MKKINFNDNIVAEDYRYRKSNDYSNLRNKLQSVSNGEGDIIKVMEELYKSTDYLNHRDEFGNSKEEVDGYSLEVINFLGVTKGKMNFDNNIVIGGFNSTGKTTMLKASYVLMKFLSKLHSSNALNDLGSSITLKISDTADILNSKYVSSFLELLLTEVIVGTYGYKCKDLFNANSTINYLYKGITIITISRTEIDVKLTLEKLLTLPYPRNVYYIESPRVLDRASTILNPDFKTCDSNVTLDYSTVMSYERDLLLDLFTTNTNSILLPSNPNDKESLKIGFEYLENSSKSVDNILTRDKYGNAILEENSGKYNMALVGGGVKLISIIKVLVGKTLLASKRDVLFIDEPENGVYPHTQLFLIKDIMYSKYKVVLLTHSLFVVKASVDRDPNTYTFFSQDNNIMKQESIGDLYERLLIVTGEP